MNRRVDCILRVCELLAQQENLKVTVTESAKGAGIIGLGAFLGSLVGGKYGLLAGAALGGATSLALASEYKSLVEIMRDEMTPEQKIELVNSVSEFFRGIQVTDAVATLALLTNNGLKLPVLQQMKSYFLHEMEMNVL